MASPNKQPPKKSGGWGSLLSGAVAGLESRLDNILANEEAVIAQETSKSRPRTQSGSGNLAPSKARDNSTSREASRSTANERLAERLAKATAVKTPSNAGSAVPSRTATPVNGRQSGDDTRDAAKEEAAPAPKSVPEIAEPPFVEKEGAEEDKDKPVEEVKETVMTKSEQEDSHLAAVRPSVDSSRPSVEASRNSVSSRPSADLPNGTSSSLASKSASEYEAELHLYMEKIDALQAKLSYLASSTVAAAKAANASSESTNEEKKLAEKDEQIALLMEEGEKLSKTEMRHLQTIKKLRSQRAEDEKVAAESRKKAEKVETDLRQRLKKVEQAERAASEKNKVIADIEKELDELKVGREKVAEQVKSLTSQLKAAKERAEKAEKEAKEKSADEVDRGRIAALENDLEDAQIEKKLAEDRAAAEIKKAREELEGHQQRFSVRELELKSEIAGLEGRMEALRARAEEQGVEGSTGESNVQLLRQVETLQRQYALAKDNWEAIEASLSGRAIELERERDELRKREAEARKKAREAALRTRKVEEELEAKADEVKRLTDQLDQHKEDAKDLQRQLEESKKALDDLRAEHDRQRRVWEVEMQQRLDEERAKWSQGPAMQHVTAAASTRNQSPATNSRKMSSTELNGLHSVARRPITGHRLTSHDFSLVQSTESSRPPSRRSPGIPPPRQSSMQAHPNPFERSPSMSRQNSTFSLTTPAELPRTPSFDVNNHELSEAGIPETPYTPDDHNTLAELLSTSTAPAAGPTVQLVERISALVRRLESEKAAFKDEIARLSSQRDSSRDEVVSLMREVEGKRNETERVRKLQADLEQLNGRYEASLEMLGEKEEEVVELRSDIGELKRLYRELVDRKTSG